MGWIIDIKAGWQPIKADISLKKGRMLLFAEFILESSKVFQKGENWALQAKTRKMHQRSKQGNMQEGVRLADWNSPTHQGMKIRQLYIL